ncbi:hypothetical protein F444_11596 [Phytophthora nicotianae P1976]|uniref:ZNF598/HEL2 PAH domain-containing protein n=1 Tax=Phytophthora nicotianae P1976 TaxID=1317066 RepID=A0A081A029_PHYNI|nr:hypothetical protein F444_11596 [Phytophthora nicotianae P1976]
MASRPLHSSNGTRSPVRQSMAQRWLNIVSSAPSAPKPTHFPGKRWPPPKVEDPLPAPVIATPTPINTTTTEPTVEKKASVSAFQNARAVFEAKKSITAAPPPPPARHPMTFPTSPPAPVVKQHSSSSDLSTSSCSTADSEGNHKLEESVETEQEPKPLSPVRAMVKRMENESVAATPLKRHAVKASIHTTKFVSSPPTRDVQVDAPRDPAANLTTSKQLAQNSPYCNEIDPFRLLLPVEAVPTLPDEVIRVYDSAAVDMEKNIKKVVRKLLKKDKARLEEFKVNSRLFGTDFMDAPAYLDTLIKHFGSIRALQLVPCLLSVQPSMVKCNALLLAAENYLLRNEDALEREIHSLRASTSLTIAMTTAATTDNEVTTSIIEPAASKASPAGASSKALSAGFSSEALQVNDMDHTAGTRAQNHFGSPAGGNTIFKSTSTLIQPPVPEVVSVPTAISVQNEPATILTEEMTATNKEMKFAEPMPEPQVLPPPATPPPLINITVSTPYQTPVTTPTVSKFVPTPVVKNRADSDTTSENEEEFHAENLFGETITPKCSPPKQQPKLKNSHLDVPTTPASPASSVHSFDEAESLFGERLSSSSRTSPGRRKTVTWGETRTVEVPADKASPVKTKKKPAPLLFGLATAAAFDSDSDDSDSSD